MASRKISKEKGIELCVDDLYKGASTKDILRFFTENYGSSVSTVEKWLKAARPIAEARLKEANDIKTMEHLAIVGEAAKKAGVTKERLIERLAVIALGDITKIFTVDGGLKSISEWDEESAGMIAGLESFDETVRGSGEVLGTNRKVKTYNAIEAIKVLNQMLGYNEPVKSEINGSIVWHETKTYADEPNGQADNGA